MRFQLIGLPGGAALCAPAASAATITVNSGGDLQAALNAAGTHVVRVVMDADGSGGSVGNFNWFTFR